MYSHLRLVTAAALVAFAGVIAVGVPALLPAAVERPPVVGGLPWMAERRDSGAIELPLAAESTAEQPSIVQTAAPEQPRIETEPTAAQPEQLTSSDNMAWPELLRRDVTMPEQAILTPPPPMPTEPPGANAVAVAEPSPLGPSRENPIAGGASAATEPVDGATPTVRHAPTAHARVPAAKHRAEPPGRLAATPATPRRTRTAKRPAEALSAVRKFGDHLRDIPVSAYSGDGTRRDIVIRPTSIQDVYYYSAPR